MSLSLACMFLCHVSQIHRSASLHDLAIYCHSHHYVSILARPDPGLTPYTIGSAHITAYFISRCRPLSEVLSHCSLSFAEGVCQHLHSSCTNFALLTVWFISHVCSLEYPSSDVHVLRWLFSRRALKTRDCVSYDCFWLTKGLRSVLNVSFTRLVVC